MSMFSTALSHLGISTGVQRGIMGAAAGALPGGSIFAGLFGGGTPRPPSSAGGFALGGGSVGFGDVHVNLPAISFGGGGAGLAPGANGACPKGWHLNKHPLAACKSHGAVGRGQVCVRNRHMNPMNGRAVSRAARRIHRGEKLLRRIFTVEGKRHGKIHPKAHKGR